MGLIPGSKQYVRTQKVPWLPLLSGPNWNLCCFLFFHGTNTSLDCMFGGGGDQGNGMGGEAKPLLQSNLRSPHVYIPKNNPRVIQLQVVLCLGCKVFVAGNLPLASGGCAQSISPGTSTAPYCGCPTGFLKDSFIPTDEKVPKGEGSIRPRFHKQTCLSVPWTPPFS